MIRLYIDGKKSLVMNEKDALQLADIIERKTGERPKIERVQEINAKPQIYFTKKDKTR